MLLGRRSRRLGEVHATDRALARHRACHLGMHGTAVQLASIGRLRRRRACIGCHAVPRVVVGRRLRTRRPSGIRFVCREWVEPVPQRYRWRFQRRGRRPRRRPRFIQSGPKARRRRKLRQKHAGPEDGAENKLADDHDGASLTTRSIARLAGHDKPDHFASKSDDGPCNWGCYTAGFTAPRSSQNGAQVHPPRPFPLHPRGRDARGQRPRIAAAEEGIIIELPALAEREYELRRGDDVTARA